jgi:hypothetical protein
MSRVYGASFALNSSIKEKEIDGAELRTLRLHAAAYTSIRLEKETQSKM